MDVVLADGREEDVLRSLAAMEPDALDELSQSLFARITETVVSHEPEDWAMYYDRLCVVVCRVVAQSRQSDMAKTVLTRRLIEHVIELEKWWPRFKPKEGTWSVTALGSEQASARMKRGKRVRVSKDAFEAVSAVTSGEPHGEGTKRRRPISVAAQMRQSSFQAR